MFKRSRQIFIALFLFFGVNVAGYSFCTPSTASQACVYMYISNVTIGTINNTTACAATSYTDYSAQIASACQGGTVSVSLSSGGGYSMAYSIWVDFNDNGVFTDAGENVYTNANSGNSLTVSGSFAIASNATAGNHRMRVMGEYYGTGTPSNSCGTLVYGETEDYTLKVSATPTDPGTPTSNSPQCGAAVTITRSGSPAGGITWYWQTTSLGTSTASSGTTFSAGSTTTYYIRARDNTSLCWSTGQGSIAVVANGVAPGAATLLTPINGVSNVATNAALAWSAGSGLPTGYDVYFGTVSPGSLVSSNQAATSYSPSMANSTLYYWRIDSKNACGTTASAVRSFTTNAAYQASKQLLYNNGASIKVSSGESFYVEGGLTNTITGVGNGTIDNSGSVYVSGDWTNDNSSGGLTTTTGTVVLNGGAQAIGGTQTTTFNNLTLAGTSGSTKTLNINTTVGGSSGVLSIGTDILNLNSKTLTVTDNATSAITCGTGYIQSEVNAAVNPSIVNWQMNTTTGAFVYPFGVSGTQIPFTFNKTSAGAANVAISTRATVNTGSPAGSDNLPLAGASNVAACANMNSMWGGSASTVIDRWWDITASAAVTGNLTFSYRGSENTLSPSGYQTGTIKAQHWNGTGWDTPVGPGTTGQTSGVGTVTANGASTFSPWVLVSSSAPLPVEMLSFTGTCSDAGVLLKWSTATESNNDHFIIEKSLDAKEFKIVSIVRGNGTTSSVSDYSLIDPAPYDGLSYYRIEQVDYDGKTTTYHPTSVSCSAKSVFSFSAYPSIISNSEQSINVAFNNSSDDHILVVLRDVFGREAFSKVIINEGSGQPIAIDLENKLASGIYTIVATSNDKYYSQKVIVK